MPKKKLKMRSCSPVDYSRVVASRTFKKAYAQLQAAGARSDSPYSEASKRAARFAKNRAIAAGAKVRHRRCVRGKRKR